MLVELRLDEPEREPRRVERLDANLAQQVRQRADVILVRVGEHDGQHLAPLQVSEVGENQVDAEVLVPREREPRIDHDRLAPGLEDGHVLADLAEPAERDDPQSLVTHRREAYGCGPHPEPACQNGFVAVSLKSVNLGNTPSG